MRIIRLTVRLVCIAILLTAAGCSTLSQQPHPNELVTPLMKLTPAIQAEYLWGEQVPDADLLTAAIADKPELQEYFTNVPVKIWHDAEHVVVLVCSPDGQHAWLEDASWTPGVDVYWYATNPMPAATFTLVPTSSISNTTMHYDSAPSDK